MFWRIINTNYPNAFGPCKEPKRQKKNTTRARSRRRRLVMDASLFFRLSLLVFSAITPHSGPGCWLVLSSSTHSYFSRVAFCRSVLSSASAHLHKRTGEGGGAAAMFIHQFHRIFPTEQAGERSSTFGQGRMGLAIHFPSVLAKTNRFYTPCAWHLFSSDRIK